MVAIKLPGMLNVNDSASTAALSLFTYEIMSEIEKCLKVRYRAIESSVIVDKDPLAENENMDNVGNEAFYRPIEKSLIADLVAMQWLFRKPVEYIQSTAGTSGGTFIKKAKAGSAEVEYDKQDAKNIPLSINVKDMMAKFKADATRKALTLGCILDIADDLTFQAFLQNPDSFTIPSFIVVRSNCY